MQQLNYCLSVYKDLMRKCTNGRISHIWLFCDIFAYFGQKLVAMAMSLRPLHSEMSSLDWILALSVVEIHLYAFIPILVPKLVAMVTPLCSLCMGVSQMNSPIAQILSQNQTLHGYVAYN